jgi:hypothetical protein
VAGLSSGEFVERSRSEAGYQGVSWEGDKAAKGYGVGKPLPILHKVDEDEAQREQERVRG